jgi:hypothetical protein
MMVVLDIGIQWVLDAIMTGPGVPIQREVKEDLKGEESWRTMSPNCVTAWANTFAFWVKQQLDMRSRGPSDLVDSLARQG